MSRQTHRKFTVNGREYAVGMMPAVRALKFGLDVAKAAGPSLAAIVGAALGLGTPGDAIREIRWSDFDTGLISTLAEQAREFLVLPGDKQARDALAYEKWVSEYPEDFYLVSLMSVWHLAYDFLPITLRSLAAKLSFGTVGETPQSSSPTDGM